MSQTLSKPQDTRQRGVDILIQTPTHQPSQASSWDTIVAAAYIFVGFLNGCMPPSSTYADMKLQVLLTQPRDASLQVCAYHARQFGRTATPGTSAFL